MDWLIELVTNPFLITGASAWFFAQAAKTIIYAIIHKKIEWERLVGDGGMPSAHSATVSSIAMLALLAFGPGSFEFAVSLFLAVIVCHDAMGVRRETGKQTLILNELIKSFEIFESEKMPEVKLKEFVGHTPVQVAAGILIGIAGASLMYFFVY